MRDLRTVLGLEPLPAVFVWNRLLFLGLAVLLVTATVGYVGRQRQGRV